MIIPHKPYDFWQIRPAEGILVHCADGTHYNHFAIFPAFPCICKRHTRLKYCDCTTVDYSMKLHGLSVASNTRSSTLKHMLAGVPIQRGGGSVVTVRILDHIPDRDRDVPAAKPVLPKPHGDALRQNSDNNSLVDRHQKALARLYKLKAACVDKVNRERELRGFIDSLMTSPLVLDAWDEQLWGLLVVKGDVGRDGSIEFEFWGGDRIYYAR